ncbi:hypothetical protein FOA43_004243 [Brettanomyces nanus]|uniref:Presequence translocated-associated motor subunit PAM17 n=1 Tax=Eeniella nana TaxID=13502 RepID=A0A875SBD9_EENNA|nr:uncharacterized protein FOA43_004243 [Brettanomyces nanus]QPG76849.1 hypothetical protein FOA43_004243 [Brettanomyces nanus]
MSFLARSLCAVKPGVKGVYLCGVMRGGSGLSVSIQCPAVSVRSYSQFARTTRIKAVIGSRWYSKGLKMWPRQFGRFNSTTSGASGASRNTGASKVTGAASAAAASKKVHRAGNTEGLSTEEIKLSRKLNWEQFLSLRWTQRRISIGSSVVGSMIAMAFAWMYVSSKEIDPTETIFGLDAFTVYIGGIMCTGVFGYLLGPPLLGDTLFNLTHRSIMKPYMIKQKLFLRHIGKMRVDASRQSMNNPVPDYYGEKISSLKDYRQWLRDCNEYRRKASEFL